MSLVTPSGASYRRTTRLAETPPAAADPAAGPSIREPRKITASFLSDPAEQPVSMVFTPLDQHGRPQQTLRSTFDPRTGEMVTTTLDGQEVDRCRMGDPVSQPSAWSPVLRVLQTLRTPATALH